MALERSAVGDFEEDHALVGVRKLEAGGHYSVAGGMHPAASATAAKLGTAAATSAAKAAAGKPRSYEVTQFMRTGTAHGTQSMCSTSKATKSQCIFFFPVLFFLSAES